MAAKKILTTIGVTIIGGIMAVSGVGLAIFTMDTVLAVSNKKKGAKANA